jgi:hypothetical protein
MANILRWSPDWFVPILIVGYLFIALYIYAPFKVKRRQTKSVQNQYTPMELTDLPSDISKVFYTASAWLVHCGFGTLGVVSQQPADASNKAFVSIWINKPLNDSAQIIGVRTPKSSGETKVATLVTFRTEFADSTSIVTSNTSSPSIFPLDPRVNSIRCPKIQDLALLYRFHRARVKREQGGRRPSLERVKDPSSRLEFEHEETFARLTKAGYYSVDEKKQNYVPTLKGAYLMTYRLLPPFRQIQKLRKNIRANRALCESGFGGIKSFRRAQSPMPAPNFDPQPV